MTRVRLTPAAATRFPDLAGRTGTVGTASLSAGKQVSVLIHWAGDHEPRETWLPVTDLVFEDGGPRSGPECRAREADGSQPLDPSDPNAPAP